MGTETINLTIDGRPVGAARGKTVLQAAREADITIPTICAHDDLPDYGACRICVVEIEGLPGFPTACTTPIVEGMIVRTQSPELSRLRQRVLALMLSGHPNACLVCDDRVACEEFRSRSSKAGRSTRCGQCSNRSGCAVRLMAIEAGPVDLRLPTWYAHYNVEREDPFIDRDHNLCILCGRCWRICRKIHGNPAISLVNRGRWAKIGAAFGRSWVDSGCTFCGACVDICPTGTLTDRYARWYGRPEYGPATTCTICPEGCSVRTMKREGRVTATQMTSFGSEGRLCAVGRFAYSQLLNDPQRLRRPRIRERGELVPVGWPEALSRVGERLAAYRGPGFLTIIGDSQTREDRLLYRRFTHDVMDGRLTGVPAGGGFEDLSSDIRDELRAGGVRAALVTGDYLDESAAKAIDYLVVADTFRSAWTDRADAILPVTILAEVEGTFRTRADEIRALRAVASPHGESRAEWAIVRDLARAMGAEIRPFATVHEVTATVRYDKAPPVRNGNPRDELKSIPRRFRGHPIVDSAPALEAMGHRRSVPLSRPKGDGGFTVLDKQEVAPNFHLLEVRASAVARHAKPGQFIIVMVGEGSERTPYTLIDWNPEEETIRFVVQELGRSSREITELRVGDGIAHVSGPLGTPLPIRRYGKVVLGGGCFGIGAIYPIARAMKQAGNRVVCVIEASSSFLLFLQDELGAVCDELVLVTKDGSAGRKGGVHDVFAELHAAEQRPDRYIAVGCTFMMRLVAESTRPLGVPLDVALSPIMVDGTGMCGACRVSVGEETRFACVDGPFFDGHAVDWDELFSRQVAYSRVEVEALPQTPSLRGGKVDLPGYGPRRAGPR